jgi:hypothetical protein
MENRGKASKAAGQPAKYLLPLRYSNPNTTPFTCTVPVSGKLELALTGGDKP